MAKNNSQQIDWLSDLEEHDYPAAESYLSLIYAKDRAAGITASFRTAPIVQFKAKDIFRASRLSLLGVSNSHVEKDMKKIRKGQVSLLFAAERRTERNGRDRGWVPQTVCHL